MDLPFSIKVLDIYWLKLLTVVASLQVTGHEMLILEMVEFSIVIDALALLAASHADCFL